MKKKLMLLLSYVLVATLAAAAATALTARNMEYTKLEQLQDLIEERFIGDADPTTLEDAAAEAMIAATGDRWSYYISAADYASYVERMENAYVGIGITILVREDGSGMEVMVVNEDGPAMEAGIQVGDVIIGVEGQSVLGLTSTDVRNLVRGEEGTPVQITLLRGEEELTLSVMRRQVKTVVATGTMLEDGVGLVTIVNFDDRCAEESIAAIESLLEQGAEKLILDVRNNGGGYAHELVALLDYLLPEGDLFRMEYYTGEQEVDTSDADCLEIPMAVLVNGESYSAAEFFAVALQEYEAAVVVGTPTSGKGYFQTTIHLLDGSAVSLSVGRYFTPKGVSLEGVGITPDVEVPVDPETELAIYYGYLQPQEDPQIQAALEALK